MSRTVESKRSMRARGIVRAPTDDALFRAHFDNLPGPAYMWRRDGGEFRLIAHNRAAGALHFSNVANLLGVSAHELTAGQPHDLCADLELAASRGIIVKREIDYRYFASHTVRRLALSLVPLSADIVVVHADDVTERRRTEQALRDSERKYRMIVDAAHEGIWTVDPAGITTYVNHRAARMLGCEPADMVGRSMLDFVDEALHAEARSLLARRRQIGSEQYDFRLRHKNGADVWVSVAASPVLDHSSSFAGTIHMIADITERKRAEHALRESEIRIRALLDAHPDLILRVDRAGRYLDVHCTDPCVEAHMPRPLAEFIGASVRDVFGEEFAREHGARCERALASGEVQRWETARCVEGAKRYVEARFVKSGDDEVVVTWRDITQQVDLEREVVASSEREKTRIGHDLHDGLAQLLIGVKLMLEALKEKLAASGSRYSGDAERVAALVRRAISQTGDMAQGLSPIRKRGRLSDALHQLGRHSEDLLGVPCYVTSGDLPRRFSETAATHLYRIAQEGITNAAKHGKATRIDVACEGGPDGVVLTIADNGAGVDPAALERGGMGMHIMRYRARSIGGELTIAPRPGGGTLVNCRCPWSDEAAPAPAAPATD